jgi:hypothetical protein
MSKRPINSFVFIRRIRWAEGDSKVHNRRINREKLAAQATDGAMKC